RPDEEADRQGPSLLEVGRGEDQGQRRRDRDHSAAEEAGAEQDEAAAGEDRAISAGGLAWSAHRNKLITVLKIPELARKIPITTLFLLVYRIGFYVPLPIIDQAKMQEAMSAAGRGALGQVLGFVSLFSGGTLGQCVIFSLGVMPYISASIIFQLL